MAIHSNLGGVSVEVHSPESIDAEGHAGDFAMNGSPGVADRRLRMDGQLRRAGHIKFIPAEVGEVYSVLLSQPV